MKLPALFSCWLILGLLAMSTACVDAMDPDDPATPRATLRELVAAEAPLVVTATPTAGVITASRRSDGAWIDGTVDLGLERGTIALAVDARGGVAVTELALALTPIALPEDLIGQPAELTQVRAVLRAPAAATTTWFGTDSARATAMVELDLTWTLSLGGAMIPIFAPDLPPLPLVMDLDGDGHVITADVKLLAEGELWSWAGLVRLASLRLVLAASTERALAD